MDQGLLIIDASRSHSDTPQSVGQLWTSDQLIAETSTSQQTDIHAPLYSNLQSQQASGPHGAVGGTGFRVYYKMLIEDELPVNDLNKLQRGRAVHV